MQLSLGAGTQTLSDGSSSFNRVAQDALNVWNGYLTHLHLAPVFNSPVAAVQGDDEMSVIFSDSIFGTRFGSGTLAVTLLNYRGTVMEETDTLLNTSFRWDSYRGPLRSGVQDARRILVHEFGHTLGLDHPDDAGQHVTAIMNSAESNVDTVQADDISGVQSLYSTGPAFRSSADANVLRNVSTRALIGSDEESLIGGFVIQGSQPATVILRGIGFSLSANGLANPLMDPEITVYDSKGNIVGNNDDWFTSPDATTIASYQLDPPNSIESAVYVTLAPGSYTAAVHGFTDAIQTAGRGVGLVEVYDLHTSTSRLGNISTRGIIEGTNNALIGGFIIGGGQAKPVVVRALGPSLAAAGVANPIADPTLELRDSSGNLLAANDDWQQSASAALLQSENLAPSDPSESALQTMLAPGSYTALVRGAHGGNGVGLVEVYDLSTAPP